MDNLSLANIFLGYGGQTFTITGTAFNSVGMIYGIYQFLGASITLIKQLPRLLEYKSKDNEEQSQVLVTKDSIIGMFKTAGTILAVIGFGTIIKMFGNWLSLDSTIKMFENYLYKASD